jgi:hypothetical protein
MEPGRGPLVLKKLTQPLYFLTKVSSHTIILISWPLSARNTRPSIIANGETLTVSSSPSLSCHHKNLNHQHIGRPSYSSTARFSEETSTSCFANTPLLPAIQPAVQGDRRYKFCFLGGNPNPSASPIASPLATPPPRYTWRPTTPTPSRQPMTRSSTLMATVLNLVDLDL